ncbi:Mitochondrial distribution and morphology protein 10 [Puccinia graminis f. sp. tritici]|uniref:Mitochondrial distribution and morphology protein 10 n=1 Tax=Puccinia graminis f. sp. tritici TaxID=56615 RepID=A0A5B0SHR1_PUCGR|nr:Mitochondrial distribution and morphology protein 10 [Puccinia graminis f. sp. tritici]KAA1137746.1 Mitochondrial distribution and morphology protein 10 [Puccinia graminis f. sp. tritici]
MHPFGSQLLSSHYAAIGWDPDNDYAQLTKPTRALLDLNFLPGIHFSLGKLPAHQFANSASLSVLSPPSNISLAQRTLPQSSPYPTLTGSVSYVASSIQSFQLVPTRLAALTTVVDRFAVPSPPPNKSAEQHNGTFNTAQDYLLYGRFHIPTYRLDALYSYQFSPTLQALATLVSVPSSTSNSLGISGNGANQDGSPVNHMSNGIGGPSIWNMMVSMNHDTGKWSQQYSYSTEDGLFGARVLHNFPATTTVRRRENNSALAQNAAQDGQVSLTSTDRKKLIDEDEVMDNVLKGRFSVGGELYFSAQRKSAGVSTGIRFCTIPDPPGAALTQQPTVINATLNPIMGQISTSYGTKIGPNLAMATRFDFNFFSFDSDITFGLELLQKKRAKDSHLNTHQPHELLVEGADGKRDLKIMEKSYSNSTSMDKQDVNRAPGTANNYLIHSFWRTVSGLEDTLSILRARVSPVTGLTLMWEGRWKECLIGIGIQSEFLVSSPPLCLSTTTHPSINEKQLPKVSSHPRQQSPLIKGICLELQYTTDN